ncbi:regulatory protein [Arboricoccus pini]|uniref:Regulatory protein RecX n=1 Tax=Arboricoccus pini TaxID=1963835 RepID=A0A212RE13_9PROT|nr:RecX family transcriptional regulator [Arboricoccus pini]SNB70534.1 regulatory protein [Arboricoccus pini]
MSKGAPSEETLQAHAVRYLGRYAASRAHLLAILRRRAEKRSRLEGFELDRDLLDQRAERVLARLTELGLLDDAAYAAARARSLARRGRSPGHIALALRQRGLGRAEIESGLASLAAEDEDPALSSARVLARRKRLGPYRPEAERAAWHARDLARLMRAGFDYGTARLALSDDEA